MGSAFCRVRTADRLPFANRAFPEKTVRDADPTGNCYNVGMPNYHRAFRPGGTFFFTLVTYDRSPFLCEPAARTILRAAIDECRIAMPFEIDAIVLLPDHLHAIWTLPDGDADFSKRWGIIKKQ